MDSPRRTEHLGVAFLLGVVAVLAVGLIVVLSQGVQQKARDTAITQAHTLADPILQLCDQGGDVAARLSAKGLCGAAEVVHSEPLGAASATGMTAEQVQAMIRAELARRPPVVIQQPAPVVVPARPNAVVPNAAPIPPVMNHPRPFERPRAVTPQRRPDPAPRYLPPEPTSRRPTSDYRNDPNDRQRESRRGPYRAAPPYQQRESSRQREQQPYQREHQPYQQRQRPYQQQQPYRRREQQQSPPAMPAPQSRRPEGLLSNLLGHVI